MVEKNKKRLRFDIEIPEDSELLKKIEVRRKHECRSRASFVKFCIVYYLSACGSFNSSSGLSASGT